MATDDDEGGGDDDDGDGADGGVGGKDGGLARGCVPLPASASPWKSGPRGVVQIAVDSDAAKLDHAESVGSARDGEGCCNLVGPSRQSPSSAGVCSSERAPPVLAAGLRQGRGIRCERTFFLLTLRCRGANTGHGYQPGGTADGGGGGGAGGVDWYGPPWLHGAAGPRHCWGAQRFGLRTRRRLVKTMGMGWLADWYERHGLR